MIGKSGGNFLTAHYDWIAAAVALVALVAGGMMFVKSLNANPDDLSTESLESIRGITPGGEPVKPADMTDFNRAVKMAKSPVSLLEVADDKGSFLASEARMFCTNCQALVMKDAKTCPSCNATLERIDPVSVDADGDGLPNEWETKYGLNPNDPSDANLDKDGDGFTNLEEFEAKTDPTDRDSHPDYLDSLTIQLPLKETSLPFFFTGAMKTPAGLKYQFKDPSRAKEYDRGVYSLLAGEEIGKSGFAPKEFVEKTVERKMGGGMTKKVDASEAVVVRKSDGKRVAMAIGRRQVPVDVQATLVYARDGGKNFDVVMGDSFELNGTKYIVKGIKRVNKSVKVALECGKSGKIRELSALEP